MSKELEHIESQLKRIESELQSLAGKKANLTAQGTALLIRMAELQHGVKVGSVVRCKGIEHRVTKVDVGRWYGRERRQKPWVEGNPRRKDGKFGTSRRSLYEEWELVTAHREE